MALLTSLHGIAVNGTATFIIAIVTHASERIVYTIGTKLYFFIEKYFKKLDMDTFRLQNYNIYITILGTDFCQGKSYHISVAHFRLSSTCCLVLLKASVLTKSTVL